MNNACTKQRTKLLQEQLEGVVLRAATCGDLTSVQKSVQRAVMLCSCKRPSQYLA